MKKQPKRIVVPKFATEQEETEWWYKNRHVHDKIFHAAAKIGEAQTLTREKRWERISASKKKPSPVVALAHP